MCEDLKYSLNRRKKDYNISLGYYDSRDNRRVIKRRDYRENKKRRRRRTGESLGRRGKKIKKRRSSSLYR
jgi:hypothetical protein